jgi:hypothetical protein
MIMGCKIMNTILESGRPDSDSVEADALAAGGGGRW